MATNKAVATAWVEELVEHLKDDDFFWAIERLIEAKEKKEWTKIEFTIKDGKIKIRRTESTEIFSK